MRKTLAQQSCLQLKGPVRRYRPDAEAPDAPLRIAVLSIGQRHSLRVGPGCRPAQRKFRTSRMPSRADVRANFSSPSLCFTRMKPSRRSIPGLVERGQGRGFEYLHYPDAEPHITLGVNLPSPITTPVNGLGALISLIFGVNGPSRGGCALAFVNASEAGVPISRWLPCYLSRALVRIARRRACVRSSLLGQVDVRDQLDVAARAFSSG